MTTETVAAVDRAFQIMDAFADSQGPLTLHDLAARTGLYKSTILRLVSTLIAHGCILRLDDRVGEMNTAGREDCLQYRDPLLKSSLASWAEALGRMLLNRDQNTWFDAAVGAGAAAHLPAAPQPPTPSVKIRAEAKVLASTTDPVIAAAIRAKEARARAKTKAMAVAIPMARAAAPGHQGGGGS